MNKNTGFSLLELLVVVTVIGIIGSIAVGAYQSYVEDAQSTLVADNYERAIDQVRSQYIRAESLVAMQVDINTVVPDNAAGWINLLNTNGKNTPTGAGAAYSIGVGDSALGSVGVDYAGDYSAGTSVVTITQPDFGRLPVDTTLVAQSDF